ncbi:MAG: hypothetical protein MRY72_10210 [Aquisalinus sp.]|nr:hypothetical protein [Aquisalinus sp.]
MIDSTSQSKDTLPNLFRKSAKVPFETTILLVKNFACGAPIEDTANVAGVSLRTTRDTFRQLRPRLLRPAFSRWHPDDKTFIGQAAKDQHDANWQVLRAALGQCHDNKTCWRNYRDSKRVTRLCRSCPISAAYDDAEFIDNAIRIVDHVRAFYSHLGWSTEHDQTNPSQLIYERLIHANVIRKAQEATRKVSEGHFDFEDDSDMSVRTMYGALVADLIAEPL